MPTKSICSSRLSDVDVEMVASHLPFCPLLHSMCASGKRKNKRSERLERHECRVLYDTCAVLVSFLV